MLFKIWSDSTLTTRRTQADCEAGSCGFGPEFCGIGANVPIPIWLWAITVDGMRESY